MKRYVVIKDFKDLQDNNYVYRANKPYPHHNRKVDEKRIKELSTSENALGTPLIKEQTANLEELTKDELKTFTNDELKERLSELKYEYKESGTKDELIDALLGGTPQKEGDTIEESRNTEEG